MIIHHCSWSKIAAPLSQDWVSSLRVSSSSSSLQASRITFSWLLVHSTMNTMFIDDWCGIIYWIIWHVYWLTPNVLIDLFVQLALHDGGRPPTSGCFNLREQSSATLRNIAGIYFTSLCGHFASLCRCFVSLCHHFMAALPFPFCSALVLSFDRLSSKKTGTEGTIMDLIIL